MQCTCVKVSLIAAIAVMTVGCASSPRAPSAMPSLPSRESIVEGLSAEGVKPPVGTSTEWKQKTKAKVAGATALATVGALFGGGTLPVRSGPRNAMPAGGYVDLAANEVVFGPDEALKFNDPAAAEAEVIARHLASSGVAVSPAGRYSVSSRATIWGLDYDQMTEKDNYRIYYSVDTSVSDGKSIVHRSSCQGVTQDKRSFEDWMANDKAEVRKAAAVIGDLCADKWMADLGLAPAPVPATERGASVSHSASP